MTFQEWHKENQKYIEPMDMNAWLEQAFIDGAKSRDAEIAAIRAAHQRYEADTLTLAQQDDEVKAALTAERDAFAANVKVLREALEGLLDFGSSNNVDVVKGRFNAARQSLEQTK